LLSTVFLPEKKNKSSLYENALLNVYATFIRVSFSVKKKMKARFKKIVLLNLYAFIRGCLLLLLLTVFLRKKKLEQYYLALVCGFS
jgi:hypothetical protein